MSKSKEDILKEAYESTFTSPKYEKSHLQHTYENVLKPAMDEYAKIVAIEFAEWIENENYVIDTANIDPGVRGKWYKISGVTEGRLNHTIGELYALFLDHKSKQK